LQRKCSVGFNKAGKIIEWMEEMHYIAEFDGSPKPRKTLITKEEFEKLYGEF
jgi:DNA segregation ATPase FtsK/SpoIIIE-like protein